MYKILSLIAIIAILSSCAKDHSIQDMVTAKSADNQRASKHIIHVSATVEQVTVYTGNAYNTWKVTINTDKPVNSDICVTVYWEVYLSYFDSLSLIETITDTYTVPAYQTTQTIITNHALAPNYTWLVGNVHIVSVSGPSQYQFIIL